MSISQPLSGVPAAHSRTFEQELAERIAAETARARRNRHLGNLVIRVVMVVAFFTLWQALSGPVLRPFFFSSPVAIFEQLQEWVVEGDLAYHLGFTLQAMFLGYLLGVTLGIISGVFFGLVYSAYRVVEPLVLVIYSIPTIAIGPLVIIWFGLGMTPKIILAAFFVYFVMFMNTVTGIRNINTQLIDIARVMGGSRRQIITQVVLPNASYFILTAMRITLPTALIGAVVAEFISSNRGIAYLIMASSMRYNTAGTFAAVFVLASVVIIMNVLLSLVETRMLRWRPTTEAAHV